MQRHFRSSKAPRHDPSSSVAALAVPNSVRLGPAAELAVAPDAAHICSSVHQRRCAAPVNLFVERRRGGRVRGSSFATAYVVVESQDWALCMRTVMAPGRGWRSAPQLRVRRGR